jgi:hypothetical protein
VNDISALHVRVQIVLDEAAQELELELLEAFSGELIRNLLDLGA